MKSIAIITARGGSKRIPKKNIKEFCGKPILAYSIIAALESGLFEEVMVSTDNEEIADIAKSYGAQVPFLRSDNTSNDFSTTADVLNEVILNYERQNKFFDTFCCIYPTAPFITSSKLCQAMELLEKTGADSVMPVVKFSFPPQRAVVIQNGKITYQYPENAFVRSQDLMPIFHDCGQFYVCRTDKFKKYCTLITPNTVPFIMPEEEVQDIDNLTDWELAEIKYERMVSRQGGKKNV